MARALRPGTAWEKSGSRVPEPQPTNVSHDGGCGGRSGTRMPHHPPPEPSDTLLDVVRRRRKRGSEALGSDRLVPKQRARALTALMVLSVQARSLIFNGCCHVGQCTVRCGLPLPGCQLGQTSALVRSLQAGWHEGHLLIDGRRGRGRPQQSIMQTTAATQTTGPRDQPNGMVAGGPSHSSQSPPAGCEPAHRAHVQGDTPISTSVAHGVDTPR